MTQTAKIAELNDRFRKATWQQQSGRGEPWRNLMTSGIRALGLMATVDIAETVMAFDTFTAENDPHREHDFGSFEYEGQRIFLENHQ
jgi:Protein of unknown function (DUF3768)